MTEYYRVADFTFAVTLDKERDPDKYLPSFRPFRVETPLGEEKLFELVESASLPDREKTLLEEDTNDMGHTTLYRISDGYRIELRYEAGGQPHVFDADSSFTRVRASVRWDDRYASVALTSILRIVFSQAVLPHGAVSLHASVVVEGGYGYLFMGKSGTGKSTHSRLWLECFDGARLLNDDNPIVRVVGDKARVYGSPWSGKTPCYRNESAPVAAFVRLRQAKANRFVLKTEVEAFGVLLPGCSVLRQNRILHESLCGTLIELAGLACVGELECLPDKDAAELCKKECVK